MCGGCRCVVGVCVWCVWVCGVCRCVVGVGVGWVGVGWDGGVDGQAGMKAEAGLGCETERDKHCLKSEAVCR